jgi:hypothetical protein
MIVSLGCNLLFLLNEWQTSFQKKSSKIGLDHVCFSFCFLSF